MMITALFSMLCLAVIPYTALAEGTPGLKRVQALVKQADTLRMPLEEGRMIAHITLVSNDDKSRPLPFLIDFSAARERRVETLGGVRKGQRVLLTPQGYWLFMQGIAKPVRLSRLQRMLGQASFGDIGNLRFAEDYKIVSWSEFDNGLLRVQLIAHDPSQFIEDAILVIDPETATPLRAEFMFPSGKIFKLLEFSLPDIQDGITMIRNIRFLSPDNPNHFTMLEYRDLHPETFGAGYFTVEALTRREMP
jgi:hypothetical protein